MRDPNNPCLFCNSKASGIAHENNLAYASYDTYPVSQHHCLIIPKRHVVDYFQLSDEELIACNNLIKIIKEDVLSRIGELGVFVNEGEITFNPSLLRESEFVQSSNTFIYTAISKKQKSYGTCC